MNFEQFSNEIAERTRAEEAMLTWPVVWAAAVFLLWVLVSGLLYLPYAVYRGLFVPNGGCR